MDEKKFQVIFKTGRDQTVQCRECGVKSEPVREGEGVEKWCEEHVCGEEVVATTEDTKPADPPAPTENDSQDPPAETTPDPETTETTGGEGDGEGGGEEEEEEDGD